MKHVGATNFDVQRLQEMVEGGVKIVNNQALYSTAVYLPLSFWWVK